REKIVRARLEGVRATQSASIAPPRLAIAAELGSTLRGTTFVTSSDSSFEGAGGRGVELVGYTAGEIRLAAGDASVMPGRGHDGGGARVNQPARGNQVVVRIGHHHEALFGQGFRRFDELEVIREKGLLVADDFELYPVRKPHLARHARGANRLVSRITPGGVRQDEILPPINIIEQRFF